MAQQPKSLTYAVRCVALFSYLTIYADMDYKSLSKFENPIHGQEIVSCLDSVHECNSSTKVSKFSPYLLNSRF